MGCNGWIISYLNSHQHLVLGGAEVVALCQEDLPKGPLAQLPLQHDVSPLNVLDVCEEGNIGNKERVREREREKER